MFFRKFLIFSKISKIFISPDFWDFFKKFEDFQKQIIEDLRDENIKSLDPIKSLPIKEDSLAKLSVNKNNNLQNHLERTKSIRDLQNQKLVEFGLYTPKVSDNKNREEYVNEEEEELHKLSRALKNIKSQDEVLKLEKKIQTLLIFV